MQNGGRGVGGNFSLQKGSTGPREIISKKKTDANGAIWSNLADCVPVFFSDILNLFWAIKAPMWRVHESEVFPLYRGWRATVFLILIWLVVLRIYVALAVFQPYRDLEAGDNQSLKFKWQGGESNPGPLAPQAKSLTTRPPPLLFSSWRRRVATSPILFF